MSNDQPEVACEYGAMGRHTWQRTADNTDICINCKRYRDEVARVLARLRGLAVPADIDDKLAVFEPDRTMLAAVALIERLAARLRETETDVYEWEQVSGDNYRDAAALRADLAAMTKDRDQWKETATMIDYAGMVAQRDAALARAEAAEPGSDALLRFAGECLDPWPDCLCDLEGEMQDRLHRAGLIEERVATETGDEYDVGDTVYFLTELGLAATKENAK